MELEKIKDKLTGGDKYYSLLEKQNTDLFNQIYNFIESYSDIEDSNELSEIIGAVSEAMGSIQADTLKTGYSAGINDTLQELTESELKEFEITDLDLKDFEFTEADRKEFEKMEKELEELNTEDFFKDFGIKPQ